MTFNIPSDWTFKNTEVAKEFDSHVRESLPWYDLVSGAVAFVARHYLPQSGLMYDIGASTGNIGKLLDTSLTSRNARLISIESSEEMRTHFEAQGELVIGDCTSYSYEFFDVATLFLILMFLTLEQRQKLVEELYSKCKIGGAIIVVDKIETKSDYLGTINRRLTLAGKVSSGVSAEQIIAKELSLAGMQRPLKDYELPVDAQQFFRFGEFAGWVIEKN